MRKHINNVLSLISKNPYSFTLIVLIMICISMIPNCIKMLGSGTQVHYLVPPFNPFGVSYGTFMEANFTFTSLDFLKTFLIVLGLLLVTAFLKAGYLSYLDSEKDEKNHTSLFFLMGIKKLFRAWGALIIQTIVGTIVLLAIFLLIAQVFIPTPTFSYYVFLASLAILALLIVVFFIFVIYEAVLTDTPFFSIISASFRKAKKVFARLYLYSLLLVIFYIIMSIYLPSCIFIPIATLVSILAIAFIYYPLYKLASEKDTEKKEKTPKYADIKKATGDYVGSRNEIFHNLSCRHAKRIEYGTETYFSSREEAIEKEFAPCKHCKP